MLLINHWLVCFVEFIVMLMSTMPITSHRCDVNYGYLYIIYDVDDPLWYD